MNTLGMVDLKTRSKLFLGFEEALEGAQDDFDQRLGFFYEEDDDSPHEMTFLTVMNPSYLLPDIQDQLEDRYGKSAHIWDENCAASLFFTEVEEAMKPSDEEEELEQINDMHPGASTWMAKYEVYFVEDAIEFTKNGEYIFNAPASVTSSTYH